MDSAKRPLELPPDFVNYAEEYKLFEMFKFLQEQLIIKRPANPLEFLIECLKYKEVIRVLIIGPPASGKSTLAHMISQYLNLVYMNMDNLIERSSFDLQEEALKCQGAGKELSQDLLLRLIIDRIDGSFACRSKGWVLEGVLTSRLSILKLAQTGVCPSHCSIYHTTFDWPANPAIQKHLTTVPGCSEREMVARLLKYHLKVDELMTCFPHISKRINADDPKADIFSEALAFLATNPRSMAPHHPRIILLGAFGSGRRTQAKLLAERYHLINVSCDQLLKEAIEGETKMGVTAKNYVDKQKEIPNVVILTILKERLTSLDCMTYGWVLHGFPVNKRQAEQMDIAGLTPSRVFFLDVPLEAILERITEKRTDPVTGQQYHLEFEPPGAAEVMSRLCINPAHNADVVNEKFKEYQNHEEELSEVYRKIGIHVNADQNYYSVFEIIESIIVHPVPKKFEMNAYSFHETVCNGTN